MCSTNNGFTIAEQDLKLRGPGDFFGQRQHGIPSLRMANLLSDMRLVEEAARLCDEVLSQDPRVISTGKSRAAKTFSTAFSKRRNLKLTKQFSTKRKNSCMIALP